MKSSTPLTIAFLYNTRKQTNAYHSQFQNDADLDDPQTIAGVTKNLASLGYRVIPIEADQHAYLKLYKHQKQIDLVFNYAEGFRGADREAQIPAMLEMLQIPYTGSGPLTQCLSLNKAKAKEIIIAHQIPTLPFQVFASSKDKLNPQLAYPLIVKPIAQGSSAGISNNSVVNNKSQLVKQIKFILDTFRQPALVEPFLTGREFSVPMLGNPPQILPIIEPDHSLLPPEFLPLDSLEVKWQFEEESDSHHLRCPAKIDQQLNRKINQLCLQAWEILDIRDWCRLDLRCDQNNNPYFLEFNSPAGIIPPEISQTSYLPLSARAAGISYPQLLQRIIDAALNRLKT